MNKNIPLIINGFAAGWLVFRGNFTWDCIIAYVAIGFTTVYLADKSENK